MSAALHRFSGAERSAAPGLVSLPTTPTGALQEAKVRGEAADLRKSVGAFKIDPKATILPRLRRAVGFAARAHGVSEKGHRNDVCWMVTLTYRGLDDWKPEHLTRCMDAVRVWCKRSGFNCRYVWVAELQKRGAIHYHIALWIPRGVAVPHFDERGWWPHGMTRSEQAKHATAYMMSYLKKGSHDGAFPKGSRRYGVGGLDHALRRARRWLGLPSFVKGNSSIWDRWTRAVGGGWCAPDGSVVPSEFERIFVGDSWSLRRVHAHATSIEADGAFSWITDREIALKHIHH